MTRRRWWTVALLLVVALTGAACGDDDDGGAITSGEDDNGDAVARPTFASGTTMGNLQSKGKLTVGVKFDQPGFGQKNPTSGKIEGFDVEIAKLVAQGLFGGRLEDQEANIEFVEAVSKNREPFIQEGRVDVVIATYTINDTRKAVVDFAGPYFVAQQDMMVKADNNSIKSVTDLGGKRVCTVKGSTSEKNVRAKAPTADVLLFDTYSQCAEALGDDRVVAVTTDNTILAGLVEQSNGAYKLVKAPFSDEPYGLGLQKGDDPFRDFLNDRLEVIFANGQWAAAFERTLGEIGLDTPEPPEIDRYVSSASTSGTGSTSTTTGGGGGTSSSTSSSTSTSAVSSTTSTTR